MTRSPWSLALVILACACRQPEREAEVRDAWRDEPHEQAGDAIAGPAGASWSRAWVSVTYSPPEHGVHARHTADVDFVLHLVVSGRQRDIPIDELSSYDVSHAQLEAFARGHPLVKAAPDGHALAVSLDGGTRWSLVVVDAGDRPFPCPHLAVDPARLPATRDFVLSILRAPAPHWTLRGSSTPRDQEWSAREVEGALRFAIAHPDDAEIREAWASYLVRPGREFPYPDGTVFPILAWIQQVGCDDERVRDILLRAVASTDADLTQQRSRAARALARCPRVEAQDALGRLVRREMDRTAEADDSRFFLAEIAWSLASATAARRAASTETFDVLAALAREPDRTKQNAGRAARIYAIRALAAIASRPARALLEELARTAPDPWLGDEPRVVKDWPGEFSVWDENMGGEHDIGAWARAALAGR